MLSGSETRPNGFSRADIPYTELYAGILLPINRDQNDDLFLLFFLIIFSQANYCLKRVHQHRLQWLAGCS
jgi:hypothetical protein